MPVIHDDDLGHTINGGPSSDTINGNGGDDTVYGADGNDIIDGGVGNDALYGEAGDDSLNGWDGDDRLYGGEGRNELVGGDGNDILEGGDDLRGSFLDGGQGDDAYFRGTVRFTTFDDITVDLTTTIAQDTSQGFDRFDQIVGLIGGRGSNHFTGDAGANLLIGGESADILNGGDGADILLGLGAEGDVDRLFGGAGDDLISNLGLSDQFIEDIDGVPLWRGDLGVIVTPPLEGLYAPSPVIISGGAGSYDTAYLSFTGLQTAISVQISDPAAVAALRSGGAHYGTITEIESLIFHGGAGDDIVTGGGVEDWLIGYAGGDTLAGGDGDDFLAGDDGNDTLNGGGGADMMVGGLGDDIYQVDDAYDAVVEATGEGNDTIYASVDYVLGGYIAVETLATNSFAGTKAINLTGNALSNVLYGNEGGNMLHGGGGADIMVGMGGADVYFVDSDDDYVLEAVDGGYDTLMTSVSYSLLAGQEVEAVATTYATGVGGAQAINLTGNEFSQAFYGTDGANVIDGGAGGDWMFGFLGDDTYVVDDIGDRVFDTGGYDTVRTTTTYALQTGVEVEVLAAAALPGGGGVRSLDLIGNEFSQAIYGDDGHNVINGVAGGDWMFGFGGDDTYLVDDGNDRIFDTSGHDTVCSSISYRTGFDIEVLQTDSWVGINNIDLTGQGAQVIYGNEGANTLWGGGIMAGMGGADTYKFASMGGSDTALTYANTAIIGFDSGIDRILLDDALFGGIAQSVTGSLSEDHFYQGQAAHDRDDKVMYDAATGFLLFDPDGTGVEVAVHLATLYNFEGGHPQLTFNDLIPI